MEEPMDIFKFSAAVCASLAFIIVLCGIAEVLS
jgi:hypothetical protein